MFVDRAGDLRGGQDQPAGSVQHDIDGDGGVGEMNRTQHFFRVVHIDVAINRESEKTHRLLPVDEQDDTRLPLAFEPGDQPLPGCFQVALLQYGLERGEDKKQPNDIASRHWEILHFRAEPHAFAV